MKKIKKRKFFGIEYGDNFHVTLYVFGIRMRGRALYNLFFGNPLKTNCSIFNLEELLRKKTLFLHPVGVCIAEEATIGENCSINQNVTIGRGADGFPTIGNNVQIYTGAVIIGKVKIGDGAIIGANAVVTKNVAPMTVVAGVPAKYIREVKKEEYDSYLRFHSSKFKKRK